MSIGKIIKQAIFVSKYTSIAEFARHAKINEAVVHSHIKGYKSPSVGMLERYAKGLGMRLSIKFETKEIKND